MKKKKNHISTRKDYFTGINCRLEFGTLTLLPRPSLTIITLILEGVWMLVVVQMVQDVMWITIICL